MEDRSGNSCPAMEVAGVMLVEAHLSWPSEAKSEPHAIGSRPLFGQIDPRQLSRKLPHCRPLSTVVRLDLPLLCVRSITTISWPENCRSSRKSSSTPASSNACPRPSSLELLTACPVELDGLPYGSTPARCDLIQDSTISSRTPGT